MAQWFMTTVEPDYMRTLKIREQLNDFLAAVDTVCGECLCTDGDECERCRVQETADRVTRLAYESMGQE